MYFKAQAAKHLTVVVCTAICSSLLHAWAVSTVQAGVAAEQGAQNSSLGYCTSQVTSATPHLSVCLKPEDHRELKSGKNDFLTIKRPSDNCRTKCKGNGILS